MPDRPTGAGLTVPCASIFRSEDRDPVLVGANVTFTLHVPPIRTRRSDIHFPTPESSMYCGFEDAPSVIAIPPLCSPDFVGAKTTLNSQVAPAFRDLPQVFASLNDPEILTNFTAIATGPVLLSLTVFGRLTVPIN